MRGTSEIPSNEAPDLSPIKQEEEEEYPEGEDEDEEGPAMASENVLPHFSEYAGPHEIVRLLNLLRGPEVTITVGEDRKPFILSKSFVCAHSPLFNAAFNSGFEESQSQVVHLQDCTEATFELVIAWMFVGTVHFPDIGETDDARVITEALEFMAVADYLGLDTPFPELEARISDALGLFRIVSRKSLLTAEHIRSAYLFPKGHPVQALFVEACFEAYKTSLQRTQLNRIRQPFKFWDVVKDTDDFAADLSRAHVLDARDPRAT